MAEVKQFALPDVGEGLTEAEIITWHVKPGDTVAINDTLVEVETAKSLVELPSPYAGLIATLHAAEGDTVEVGTVIVSYGSGVSAGEDVPKDPAPETAPAENPLVSEETGSFEVTSQSEDEPAEERQSVLVGYGPTRAAVARRPRKPGYTPKLCGVSAPDSARPRATPPVRARAKNLGVDLATITPTGPEGLITHRDLDAAVALSTPVEKTGVPSDVRTPIKGVRKVTAEAMVASAFTAPHVTEWVTVDVTETLLLLDRLRANREFKDARLTPLVLIARAALSALRAHPDMNAKWDGEAGEIVQYRDVNLGIAAATPRGLLVPNIKQAQELGTRELCDRLDELIRTARAGKTTPGEMARGTFTITNIGVFGVDGGTPILNPGEAGILCVGQIARRPWEYQGEVALRSVCTLSLSFDHRLVDGQLGSEVLNHIARLLEQPALALAQ
ncbi:dihydrolipoamide acetyltransferase family protein [Rhodococcus rhodochrous]|uniref:Dihydrolipoamide acetyltransferase component of pyruvate dehydrogenase complex n=1 Tax=Rhodococcus rhodochrous TaxID=1829 RepID=A0AA46X2P1_RHORH|nr:dihydrolipoamide acetyltransferase family protein [Rhodococcus rhodochrous]MCB8914156.1 2-oxo acid dehydrogenase subunit E2 [Rhodococcus rhodochrous]UZF48340.1 2-oxo acid dehydrogenase subunit E2 [Rhodococcus rhodochrous]